VVDDDEVAQLKVLSVARQFPILNIVGTYSSAESAMAVIDKKKN